MKALLPLPLLLLLLPQVAAKPAKRHYATHDYYVLEHDERAGASLDQAVAALGVELVEQAGELPGHWLVRAPKTGSQHTVDRRRSDADGFEGEQDKVLAAFDALKARSGSSAPFSPSALTRRSQEDSHLARSVRHLERQHLRQRIKRAPLPAPPPPTAPQEGDGFDAGSARSVAAYFGIEDPMFDKQWHLVNEEYPEHAMNASGIWEQGITGEGVISCLVDDGLDYTSDDLAGNFDALGSYDFNDHVDLPTPVLFDDHHGTRCAGQIAAVKNTVCGVGVAYGSRIAGVRILSGPISDVDEAAALNYAMQNTSIYSCSWGPADDGRSMEAPGYLVEKAVVNGINNGRQGKGSVFVFAAGNGAGHGDQCNFDGYTNSIYSVTVAAVDHKGDHPYYSESCAANMVAAYTSGSGQSIVTTDVGKDKCSSVHGGTSAAAPNAVGVFALALSIRPDLTWRDIQHLCVRTGVRINDEVGEWEQTAAGRPFSYKFGYGKLDAYHFVTAARDWQVVKPQAWLALPAVQINNGTMNVENEFAGGERLTSQGVSSKITVTKEQMDSHNLESLEHVTIRVWVDHTRRGDVEFEIVSPNGIKSTLASKRASDSATTGYPGWRFMSIKHWDENPVGDWTIRAWDQGVEKEGGYFLGWSLTLWGSTIDPSKAKQISVPLVQNVLPPPEDEQEHDDHPLIVSSTAAAATASSVRPKPSIPVDTAASHTANPEASATSTPEEWFLPDLVSDQKWLAGTLAVVFLFGLSAGIYFWRRRVARRRRAEYAAVAGGDDLPMSSIETGGARRGGGTGRTKELYDAFGEVSEDEDDADEQTRLRSGGRMPGLEFHDEFLEDDPESARPEQPLYRDEPSEAELVRQRRADAAERDGAISPGSGSGSAGGSSQWEQVSHS